MTRDEILNIPAGRKLDYMIAEFVFKAQRHQWELLPNAKNTAYCRLCGTTANKRVLNTNELIMCLPGMIKDYSTDIAAAWEVLEKMDVETELHTHCNFGGFPNMPFGCKFSTRGLVYFCLAETMPLAICRAALFATLNPE